MRQFSIVVSLATILVGFIGPVRAQVPSPASPPPQWPQQASAGITDQSYRFMAPTASDAYRQGLITRWELERVEGPLPQAMEGPSPDGGNQGGGDRNN